MATKSNEEKLLSSIDGTLKDVLKELKRQGRSEIITTHTVTGPKDVAEVARDISRELKNMVDSDKGTKI